MISWGLSYRPLDASFNIAVKADRERPTMRSDGLIQNVTNASIQGIYQGWIATKFGITGIDGLVTVAGAVDSILAAEGSLPWGPRNSTAHDSLRNSPN